jgi:YD repeat-containing protein
VTYFRKAAVLAMFWVSSCAMAVTCSELETSLTKIAQARYEEQHVNVLYCLSLNPSGYPSGYFCGSDITHTLESQELNEISQRRIRYHYVGPPSTGGVVSIWYTAWESCSFQQPLEPVPVPPKACKPDGQAVGRPIIPATGEKILDHSDHVGSGADPLNLIRHYRSGRVVGMVTGPSKAGLGTPWSHNHFVSLERIGEVTAAGSTATIKLGDGSVRAFSWDVASNSWSPTNSADTLTANATGLLYKRLDDDSLWQFDIAGKLLSVTQRNGWITTYTYSAANTPAAVAPVPGLLITVSNHFGRTLSFKYNPASQLTSVTAPDGRVTSYSYDSTTATGRLITVSYPGITGGVVSKTYLYENTTFPQLLTGIIDEKGVRLATYAYDSQGRGISTQHAGGADLHTISYGPAGSATVTDPLGTQRTYNYSANKGKLAVTGADKPSGTGNGSAASRVQDAKGFVTQETDFLGINTMYTWDINRRLPLTTTRASGLPEVQTTTTQWHSTFRLPVLITEAGRSTAYTYDAQGNRLSQTVTDTNTNVSRTTSWTYNAQGQVATVTLPGGVVAGTFAYYSDTSFQEPVLGSFDPDLASVSLLLHGDGVNGGTFFADSSLTPKTIVRGGAAITSAAQSKFGGSSALFRGNGDYLSSAYVAGFSLVSGDFTIEAWIFPTALTAGNMEILNKDGVSGSSYPQYDLSINPSGKLSAFLGNGNGVSPTGTTYIGATTISLNAWHHVALVKASGTFKGFLDGVQEWSAVAAPMFEGSKALLIGYQTGQASSAYFNGYIDDVRITKGVARYTANFTTPTEAFPNIGAPLIDPNVVGHRVGDLQSITNAAGQVTQFTLYDRAGRVKQMVDSNGVVTDTAYTPRGWISNVAVTPPGGTARPTTYSYDNAGQLTGVTLPDATTLSYSYDAAHRLTGVTDTKGNSVIYTLDAMGNRTDEQVKDPSGTLQRNITRVYDALNRVQQITGASN